MLHPRAQDITGLRFGRLVASGPTGRRIRGYLVWSFLCDCGAEIERIASSVARGATSSCGCYRKEMKAEQMRRQASALNKARATHKHTTGGKPTATFTTWVNMIQRCNNPKHKSYHRYGGRGITVCARWLRSFENFLADMGEKPPGTQLDRERNNEGYEPGNCRWITPVANCNNTSSNKKVTLKGKTQNLKEWAKELGLSHQTLRNRLNSGWSEDDIMNVPVSKTNRGRNIQ